MESIVLFVLLLVVGGVWLLLRVQGAPGRIRDLERRIADLRGELEWLTDRLAELQAGRGTAPPPGPPVEPEPVPGPEVELAPEPALVAPARAVPSLREAPEPVADLAAPAAASAADADEEPPPAEPAFAGSPGPARAATSLAPAINWEQFMGVKLFAWVGGLALFLGVAFFVKYSFEHELIPPEVRVALGFLAGLGLLVGGVVMSGRRYAVTSQTLCATGVVTLYAVTFACHAVYRFQYFGLIPTFLLMSLITAAAFLVAARLGALVVAVLGMLGGFLTPVLLSTGQDNPFGLFGYVALLDLGLIAVAIHQRWPYLVPAAAAGTVLTQVGWAAAFFTVPKVWIAVGVLGGFDALFLAAVVWAGRRREPDVWIPVGAILGPFISLVFALWFFQRFPALAASPGGVLTLVLVADLCLLALVWLREDLAPLQLVAGMAVFGLLVVWTQSWLAVDILDWALGAILVFAILHSVFPVVLRRVRPEAAAAWWTHLFPPLALALVMLLISSRAVSLLVWPVVLLIDLLAIGLAVLTASLLAIAAVLVLTVVTTGLWVLRIPPEATILPAVLVVIGGFAALFLVASLFAGRAIAARVGGTSWRPPARPGSAMEALGSPELAAQLPALSAILPFLLLILVTQRLPLTDPSPVFGLALLLILLLLGLGRAFRMDWFPAVGLAAVLALEHAWHLHAFRTEGAAVALAWYLGFYAIFTVFPFLFRRDLAGGVAPWAAAALSGPLHVYLVYRVVSTAYPNDYMGLLPMAFALPAFAGLVALLRTVPAESPVRLGQLAWFGGATLFFVTLVFPLQFERQWITLGWALEGTALVWLFHRVPHPGLRLVGVGLLAVAFVRLALNPAVLSYHPRSATPILNWYLYAYGLVSACLFGGARLLTTPRHRILGVSTKAVLSALGTVLLFFLLNIEIADYFSETGAVLTFEFQGNLAQDMTYSIAWALFALGLLVVGIARGLPAARYASLGLLGVTLVKLFLHDLARLGQLYRVGALIGVAIIAIVASFLYQRYLGRAPREAGPPPSRGA